jgi:soluble lytic murein transglycosylase-like protein
MNLPKERIMAVPERQDRRTSEATSEGEVRREAGAWRGDERRAPAVAPGDGRRSRFGRLRQPLIGLGLAGMAVPMVRATSAEQPGDAASSDDGMEAPAPADAAAAADTEEALTERIAESRAEQARDRQVRQAVDRYGITRELAEDIYDIAREENIEPRLAYGLVKTESTFNERAVSPVGARGLTQVMPRTAAWLVPGTRTQDLHDRQTNLRLGFRYLDQMIDKYRGDVRLALLAYNRGPGTVDKVLKRGGNPDNGYADKVLRG